MLVIFTKRNIFVSGAGYCINETNFRLYLGYMKDKAGFVFELFLCKT